MEQTNGLYYKAEYTRQKHINEALLKCVNILYDTQDLESAINELLETISSFYNCDRAYVFEIDETAEFINNTFEWCSEGYPCRIEEFQNIPLSFISSFVEDLKIREEFYIDKTLLTPELKDTPIIKMIFNENVESIMCVPLKINGEFYGFLGLTNSKTSKDNLILLKSVATFLLSDLQRRKFTQKLIQLSFYDKLTGLRNRHAFIEQIKNLERKPYPLGIIYADLNGLKTANDTRGHEEGDKMLTECSARLKSFFHDNVYRIGGDEFVVFCEGIDKESFEKKFKNMKENWNSPYTISAGQIWLPLCENIEYYVHTADNRMYEDKQEYYKTHERRR